MTKSKIRDLLKDGELSEESENSKSNLISKFCCHTEYRDTDMPKITLPEFDSNQVERILETYL